MVNVASADDLWKRLPPLTSRQAVLRISKSTTKEATAIACLEDTNLLFILRGTTEDYSMMTSLKKVKMLDLKQREWINRDWLLDRQAKVGFAPLYLDAPFLWRVQQGCESIQLRRMVDSRMMCIMAEGWVMKCLPYLPAIPGKYDLLKISTSFANGCQKLLIAVDTEISSPRLALVRIIHQLPSEHRQITSPHVCATQCSWTEFCSHCPESKPHGFTLHCSYLLSKCLVVYRMNLEKN